MIYCAELLPDRYLHSGPRIDDIDGRGNAEWA